MGGVKRGAALLVLLATAAGTAAGQVVPGGAPLCEANRGVTSGQESEVDTDLNQARARAQGEAFDPQDSFAAVGVAFVPALSFPAELTMDGISIVGRLDDLALPASTYSVRLTLRDIDAGVDVDSVEVASGSESNGPQVVNTPDTSAMVTADLVGGTTYELLLSIDVHASGALASVDFLSGQRRIDFACVHIDTTLVDTDGDAIYDVWEEDGIDIDGGGIDLAPDELGVDFRGVPIQLDPERKDVLVEIDYMDCGVDGGDCALGDGHSHEPNGFALLAVQLAFAGAPVANPSGVDGINLWVVVSDELPHLQNCDLDAVCFDPIKTARLGPGGETLVVRRARELLFHYGLWVHNKGPGNGSSGESDGGCDGGPTPKWGDDFVVSLGSFSASTGTLADQAGTFMHELGHNLGLCHGGGDDINCKPNYLSVMSYTFQLNGLPPDTRFDYSRAVLPSAGALVENELDETVGIEDGSLQTWHGPPTDRNGIDENGDGDLTDDWSLVPGSGSIDWNLNGAIEVEVATDINNMEINNCGSSAAPPQTLEGYDDWANLHYNFRDSEFYPEGHAPGLDQEIDHETAERIRQSTWAERSRGGTLWGYSAKIVCGLQRDPLGMRLTRGYYGTTINVLNPGALDAELLKSLAVSFPPAEQAPGERRVLALDYLPAGRALEVDCEDVRDRLYPDGFPEEYLEGFVVLHSDRELDVTAVYTTAAVGEDGRATAHSSIDVENVAGDALHLDLEVAKTAVDDCFPWIGALSLCLALWDVTVDNHGPADASNLLIHDEVRRQAGWVLIYPGVYTVEPPGQFLLDQAVGAFDEPARFRVLIPELRAGETATVRFWTVALSYANLPGPDALVNEVSVGSDQPDVNAGNNSNSWEVLLP